MSILVPVPVPVSENLLKHDLFLQQFRGLLMITMFPDVKGPALYFPRPAEIKLKYATLLYKYICTTHGTVPCICVWLTCPI